MECQARAAGRALVAEGIAQGPKRKTFAFVNHRLEGNVISTIAAMRGRADVNALDGKAARAASSCRARVI